MNLAGPTLPKLDRLTGLTALNLSENMLADVPQHLGKLGSLRFLDLSLNVILRVRVTLALPKITEVSSESWALLFGPLPLPTTAWAAPNAMPNSSTGFVANGQKGKAVLCLMETVICSKYRSWQYQAFGAQGRVLKLVS